MNIKTVSFVGIAALSVLCIFTYVTRPVAEYDPLLRNKREVIVSENLHIWEERGENDEWWLVFKNGKKAHRSNNGALIAFVQDEHIAALKFGEGVIDASDLPIVVWIVPDEELKNTTPDERWHFAQRCTDGEIVWKSKIHWK